MIKGKYRLIPRYIDGVDIAPVYARKNEVFYIDDVENLHPDLDGPLIIIHNGLSEGEEQDLMVDSAVLKALDAFVLTKTKDAYTAELEQAILEDGGLV